MSSITPASFNSPYFKWRDPFLTIKVTDSGSPQEPPILEKSTSLDSDDPRWQQRNLRWRVKLGDLLVNDYLAIDLERKSEYETRNSKVRADSNINYVEKNQKYILAKFPKNYEFYVHQRAQAPDKKPHYDCYLAGMLSGLLCPTMNSLIIQVVAIPFDPHLNLSSMLLGLLQVQCQGNAAVSTVIVPIQARVRGPGL
jgi:hypothetical protein